ncbi:MAG: 50S ribosomal protein L21, partial [Nitrospira sp.]|nr:50S ribosomal protein L21 [Nitrospira sp.]
MYAIIECGGKQYKVSPGNTVKIEKLPVEEGNEVILDKVIMVSTEDQNIVGSPYVEGARVVASVEGTGKRKKVL